MFTLKRCTRSTLCIDCDSTDCLHAGDIGADCPKWVCDNNQDCENCEFIKEFQEDMRKEFSKCEN